jgi:hypothetical protein
MRDPYELLGVCRNATQADIRNAFRQRAKRLHPDANTSDPGIASHFAEINAAYEILSDPQKRAAFDRGELDANGNLGAGAHATAADPANNIGDEELTEFDRGDEISQSNDRLWLSQSRRRKTPWRPVLLACAGAAFAYSAYVHQKSNADIPVVPGWDELTSCSVATSLDGKKEISFAENHHVTIRGKSLNEDKQSGGEVAEGTWSFDENSKKYYLNMGTGTDVYTLVAPEEANTCMLIKGALDSANLRESWFAVGTSDPGDYADRDPGDRYQ